MHYHGGEIMLRYENQNLMRIEKLLERLVSIFEGQKEEEEIKKCLRDIRKDQDNIKGGDFL
jgi:hypothetical protein